MRDAINIILKLISIHCLKSVRFLELFWSVFSPIRTKYVPLRIQSLRISPYSVWMREDKGQNYSEYGHFYGGNGKLV